MAADAETLIRSGYESRREGRLAEAKRYFSEAVELCRDAAQPELLARSLTGLGQIERDLRQPVLALRHYEEAAGIYRSLPDRLRFAHTVRHVGDILRDQGALEQARPRYEEALSIYREHGNTPLLDLANAIRGFALLREEAGEGEESKSLWREARSLYQAVNVPAAVEECQRRIERLET